MGKFGAIMGKFGAKMGTFGAKIGKFGCELSRGEMYGKRFTVRTYVGSRL